MSGPALTTVTLEGGRGRGPRRVSPPPPASRRSSAAGERNLVIGRASNLRRWAADHLGRARPRKAVPGKLPAAAADGPHAGRGRRRLRRPPRPPSASGWRYERLMARYVPLSQRRDLKRPAYLRLDVAERFPRIVVQPSAHGRRRLRALPRPPGRDAGAGRAAEGAIRCAPATSSSSPLPTSRPGSPASTRRSGAAWRRACSRASEDDYRALAAQVAGVLDGAGERPREVPPWVRRAGRAVGRGGAREGRHRGARHRGRSRRGQRDRRRRGRRARDRGPLVARASRRAPTTRRG